MDKELEIQSHIEFMAAMGGIDNTKDMMEELKTHFKGKISVSYLYKVHRNFSW